MSKLFAAVKFSLATVPFLGALAFAAVTVTVAVRASCAELYYVDADGGNIRQERVDFTSISYREDSAEVRVHAPTVTCRIRSLRTSEAKALQARIANDESAQIQCLGRHKGNDGGAAGSIEIETASYSISRHEQN